MAIDDSQQILPLKTLAIIEIGRIKGQRLVPGNAQPRYFTLQAGTTPVGELAVIFVATGAYRFIRMSSKV